MISLCVAIQWYEVDLVFHKTTTSHAQVVPVCANTDGSVANDGACMCKGVGGNDKMGMDDSGSGSSESGGISFALYLLK